MSSVEQVRREYAGLQQQIAGYCEAIEDLEPGELEFNRVYDQLVRSTRQLVAADAELPAKLAEPGRQLSERIVRWSWRSQAVLGAAMVVMVAIPAVWSPSAWWLLLVLPHAVAVLAGIRVPVPARSHIDLRAAAIVLHPVGALVVAVVTGLIAAWWIVAVAVGWLVVGTLTMDKAGTR
ncbi:MULTISPECIES: hypothetical protein [Streptomyces]|uniref:hypothetical protein n=1 Tax=Streptomyces TaxID=1883 RepID=UPI0011F16F8C|nr:MULTISPECIES: hypothetical protein [Streptomyces]